MLIAHARTPRRRRRDARAVDALADPQHVPRSASSGRSRSSVWITSFSRRRRDRAAARRGRARVLLVGLGVPAQRPGHGAAARSSVRGCCPSTGIPNAGQAGHRQRRDVARRGAGRDLRPQADRAGRARHGSRSLSILAGLAIGAAVRPPAAAARRPADRPRPVPGAGVQRVAAALRVRHPAWCSAGSCSCRSTSSSCSACRRSRRASGRCRGRSRSSSVRRLTPRLAQRFAPAHVMAAGLVLAAVGLRRVHHRSTRRRASPCRHRLGRLLARHGAGLHPDDRPDHRHPRPPERAGRGVRDL